MGTTFTTPKDATGSQHFLRTMVLCSGIALLDGYDTQAIAFVAPVLAKEWQVSKEAFGLAFAAAPVGLALGTTLFGPIADRFGRKPVLTIATAFFGIFSIATSWAGSLTELAAWRFMTGIGLGAAIPNLIALTSEHAPQHRRALAAGFMFCGFPLGSILCGLISPSLIDAHDWPSVFLVGGIIPLLLVPIIHLFLIESPSWQRETSRGRNRVSIKSLFSKSMVRFTLLLWMTFFCGLLVMYFLVNWLPSIFTESGMSLTAASRTTVLLNIGGIIGCLFLMPLIDKFGARIVLPITYCAGALAIAAIGMFQPGSTAILVAIFTAGFCIVGGQFGANAFAAAIHPTAIRSTGLGCALGVGRLGSIVGPVLGGILLGTGMTMPTLFLIVAAIALLAACTLYLISGREDFEHE
jgi:MFS transporter, AAHS family, 4-hydroxybenzoate transporter